MAVKIQVEVFWVVMPYSAAVGYWCFGGFCCLWSNGILPQHYTMSQPRRP